MSINHESITRSGEIIAYLTVHLGRFARVPSAVDAGGGGGAEEGARSASHRRKRQAGGERRAREAASLFALQRRLYK